MSRLLQVAVFGAALAVVAGLTGFSSLPAVAAPLGTLKTLTPMSAVPTVEIACQMRGPRCARGFSWNGNRCERC
jgi:hypothetical protein